MKPFALLLALPVLAADHGYGPVEPPVPLPAIDVVTHRGVPMKLSDVIGSRRAALQFVFMDCQTTCPLLGSLFHNVDSKLQGAGTALISVTVTPDRDTPEKLAAWLAKFHASPRWTAVRTSNADLLKLLAAFGQKEPLPTAHSLQVFFVERTGGAAPAYVARTTELPRSLTIFNALAGRVQMAGIGEPQPLAASAKPASGPFDGAGLYHGARPLNAHVGDDAITPQAARCAGCHGTAQQGGKEGPTIVSPLGKVQLTQPTGRRGGPPSVYTETSFCTALRTGVDPAGTVLSHVMPRYDLTGEACSALWNYLTR